MDGIYICTHCKFWYDCASPAKVQDPSSGINCPYDFEDVDGEE